MSWLQRLKIDSFLLVLVSVVMLATVFPCTGVYKTFFGHLTTAAIALLFFMHGAKLSREAVDAAFAELFADQAAFVRAQVALDAARDKLATSEQIAHGKMLGVKDSVCAQYGDDSNEYAALGMKKKSERKKGGSKPKPPEA